MINSLVNLLHVYRQKCSVQSSPSQLILPENLKLLPLYTLTALKTPGFKLLQGCKLDEKITWIYKLLNMPISQIPYFFYPRIYKVSDIGEEVRILFNNVIGLQLGIICRRCYIYDKTELPSSYSREIRFKECLYFRQWRLLVSLFRKLSERHLHLQCKIFARLVIIGVWVCQL